MQQIGGRSRRGLVVVAAAVLVVLGAVSYHGGPQTPVSKTVPDCRGESYSCTATKIDHRPVNCEPWQPWDQDIHPECEYTTDGVDDVAFIADAANYIMGDRTEAEYRVRTYGGTGELPWSIQVLPGGDLLWTNREGTLRRTINGTVHSVHTFDVITEEWNGLMGLALDPRFSENRRIYLLYTDRIVDNPAEFGPDRMLVARVMRYRLSNTTLSNGTELFETGNSVANVGGRLEFGPDGKLYATAHEPAVYPEIEHRRPGSNVLRVNPDGSAPSSNPFSGSRLFSSGHRNPQGLGFNPETGSMYASEHGPWRHDELNQIRAGRNYGWTGYQCDERRTEPSIHGVDPSRYNYSVPNTPPVICFDEWTIAPSGMTFVDDPGHPWHGDLFMTGLRGNHLHRVEFEGDSVTDREVFYLSDDDPDVSLRLRDVTYFNGSLYVAGADRGFARLTPQELSPRPCRVFC